jgi:hypothetical protein
MNHLRHARYAEATHAAVVDARHVPNKAKAQSLLSIAKLSAILAASESPHAKQLNVSQTTSAPEVEPLEDSVLELKANLAVIRCQEQLQEICPR